MVFCIGVVLTLTEVIYVPDCAQEVVVGFVRHTHSLLGITECPKDFGEAQMTLLLATDGH